MDTEFDPIAYKQVRTFIGWGLVIAWIVFWWRHAEAVRLAALLQPCDVNVGSSVTDFFFGKGSACRSSIQGDFNSAIFFAVISSPLMFLLAPPLAKAACGATAALQASRLRAAEQQRHKDHADSLAKLTDQSRTDQAVARADSDRYEIITRLGAVDDQLVVLETETSDEHVKLIKLNIGQSIRDIHAKFREDTLVSFYRSDDGLKQRVDRTLAEMRRLGLDSTRLHEDLRALFSTTARS